MPVVHVEGKKKRKNALLHAHAHLENLLVPNVFLFQHQEVLDALKLEEAQPTLCRREHCTHKKKSRSGAIKIVLPKNGWDRM